MRPKSSRFPRDFFFQQLDSDVVLRRIQRRVVEFQQRCDVALGRMLRCRRRIVDVGGVWAVSPESEGVSKFMQTDCAHFFLRQFPDSSISLQHQNNLHLKPLFGVQTCQFRASEARILNVHEAAMSPADADVRLFWRICLFKTDDFGSGGFPFVHCVAEFGEIGALHQNRRDVDVDGHFREARNSAF